MHTLSFAFYGAMVTQKGVSIGFDGVGLFGYNFVLFKKLMEKI